MHLNAHRNAGIVRHDAFMDDSSRHQLAASFGSDAGRRTVAFGPRPVDAAAPFPYVAEPVEHRPHVFHGVGDAPRGFDGEGHTNTSGRCAIKVRVPNSPVTGMIRGPHIADLVVSMMTAPILYGSPLDAGRRSSRRPTQPSVGTEAGTRIEAPRSETPYENWSMAWVS